MHIAPGVDQPRDVGLHNDGRLAAGKGQDNVSALRPNALEREQIFVVAGYRSVVLTHDPAGSLPEPVGLRLMVGGMGEEGVDLARGHPAKLPERIGTLEERPGRRHGGFIPRPDRDDAADELLKPGVELLAGKRVGRGLRKRAVRLTDKAEYPFDIKCSIVRHLSDGVQ